MRVVIVGAGAMGTLLGHGFCRGGHEVTLVDLPDRVAQLQRTGKLDVIDEQGEQSAETPALITSDYSAVATPDIIVLATKSQDLPGIARRISILAGDTATIVTIQNGIPWWYLQKLPTHRGASRIDCLDPDGLLEQSIKPSQIVGCVAYSAAILESGGQSHHIEGIRFPVGEVDGPIRDRTRVVGRLFEDAGFKSRVIDDIRSEIWLKAWGALSINPISALTRATMEDICTLPQTRELIANMMREAQRVAEAYGAKLRHTIEKRIEGARAVGPHKTSMLQDVESGLPLELDALMLAVLQLADLAGEDVPTIRNIYACLALLNEALVSGQNQATHTAD